MLNVKECESVINIRLWVYHAYDFIHVLIEHNNLAIDCKSCEHHRIF